MLVTYRLVGLDGDATEDVVSDLQPTTNTLSDSERAQQQSLAKSLASLGPKGLPMLARLAVQSVPGGKRGVCVDVSVFVSVFQVLEVACTEPKAAAVCKAAGMEGEVWGLVVSILSPVAAVLGDKIAEVARTPVGVDGYGEFVENVAVVLEAELES